MIPTTATPTIDARSASVRIVVSSQSRRKAMLTPTTSPESTAMKKMIALDCEMLIGAPTASSSTCAVESCTAAVISASLSRDCTIIDRSSSTLRFRSRRSKVSCCSGIRRRASSSEAIRFSSTAICAFTLPRKRRARSSITSCTASIRRSSARTSGSVGIRRCRSAFRSSTRSSRRPTSDSAIRASLKACVARMRSSRARRRVVESMSTGPASAEEICSRMPRSDAAPSFRLLISLKKYCAWSVGVVMPWFSK